MHVNNPAMGEYTGRVPVASRSIRERRTLNRQQYYLGSDIGVTNIPGQQATISGCVDRELEQHLYNLISDNTPVFTPEPNDDEVSSCMDILAEWIAERHPLDARRMELFKLPQEQGEGCLLYTSPSPRDRQKSRMPSSA